jgi:hypothetical protein
MNRSFAPLDLVTVPRTSASSALALGTALITTARQEPALPPVFVAPLKRLTQEHEGLRTSRQYQREARGSEAFTAPQADQQLDTTWSGLHGLMTAWTKLPSTPEGVEKGQRARVVLEIVFPGGLRFLNLPYREQWGESQTRLDRLAEPAIAEHVRALGGQAFVEAIDVAHTNYGLALNLTKRKAALAEQANVRAPLEGFWEAVRSYALRVSNYLDEHRDDPAAQQLGYALLEPLASWKSSGSGRRAKAPGDAGGEEPGDAGEEPGDVDGEVSGDGEVLGDGEALERRSENAPLAEARGSALHGFGNTSAGCGA